MTTSPANRTALRILTSRKEGILANGGDYLITKRSRSGATFAFNVRADMSVTLHHSSDGSMELNDAMEVVRIIQELRAGLH